MKKFPSGLRILDAGCGTGLNASALKPNASELTGVDLSEKMIAVAKEKNLYDRLKIDNVIHFCEKNKGYFDLAVLADVACYFGNLEPLMQAVAGALTEGGSLFLSVEKLSDGREYALMPSGRFAHSETYLETVLKSSGFGRMTRSIVDFRREKDKPVCGIIVIAEKTNANANSNLDKNDKKD